MRINLYCSSISETLLLSLIISIFKICNINLSLAVHHNFGLPTWDMYDCCRRLQTILHIITSSCTRTVLSLAVSLRPVILHNLMNWGYVYASKDCHHHYWTVYILYTMSSYQLQTCANCGLSILIV